jgi:hypothetical protein
MISRYKMDIKYSLNPGLFGMVIALASVLVVTLLFQSDVTLSYGTGGYGGSGGSGGLLVCPPDCPDADIDIAEAVEADNTKNTTTAGATNQTTTNGNTTDIQFLAIQNANSGMISQINATAYTLELNNVSNDTVLFSDRPERIVESVSTSDFVGNWSVGSDSFVADAPNAALITKDIQTGLDTAIIELFNPMYDMNLETLAYTIMTENATSIDLADELGQSVLVIDSPPCNPSPNSANGLSLNDCGY